MDDNQAFTTVAPLRTNLAGWFAAWAPSILLGAVTIAIVTKYLLIFRINIHWDEFYFLSFVHDYARNALDSRLQTFHVHFFSWLTKLETDEIGEILAARMIMATLASASALLIYGIVRRFAPREAALFGVLVYLSLSVVVDHGTSFRADTIVTFLILFALFLLLRRSSTWVGAAGAGFFAGIAALVTIKTAIYLPVVALAIWCLPSDLASRVRLAASFLAVLAATFGVLYFAHDASLAVAPQMPAVSYLGETASKVLLEDGIFPRWADFLMVVAYGPLFWLMALMGGYFAWRGVLSTRRREDWLPLVLALPILTPVIYRNAFAYYFVFILPPAAVLVALFYDEHRRRALADPKSPAAGVLVMVVIAHCALLGFNAWQNSKDKIAPQRIVLAAVHDVFPTSVPYIDGFGVVGSFPRHGFFMSSWGVQNYKQAGKPYYPAMVAQAQPALLLADSPSLYAALVPGVVVIEERRLLPEDVRFLQDNYVQHWGMVFVAGKRLAMAPAGDRAAFDVAIAGDYRLEAGAPVMIDGRSVAPGEPIALAIGSHWFRPDGTAEEAVLRWAKAMEPPATEPVGILPFFGVDRPIK